MGRRNKKFTLTPKPTPGVPIGEGLECGHPGAPNNLIDGKCGTCKQVHDLENMAKTAYGVLKPILRSLAVEFRNGNLVYDTEGKTLVEWEKAFSSQSNA